MYCYNCKKDCRPHQYKIKIVDEKGEESFQDCCSIKCCDEVKKKFLGIHIDRINKMNEIPYRRLK